METITRKVTPHRLEKLPVEVHTRTRPLRMEYGEADAIVNEVDEKASLGRFDSVLVSAGYRSRDLRSTGLHAAGFPVDVLSNTFMPGQIFDATQDERRAMMSRGAGQGNSPSE